MTNEELKEKLIGIIRQGFIDADCRKPYTNEPYPFFDSQIFCIADALIAAGLRFGENLTATFDRIALEREHELERRLGEAEHRAEVLERALQGACCYIDALGEGCGCCAFIKDDLKCRENCDFLAGLTTFWRNKAEEELKGESKK